MVCRRKFLLNSLMPSEGRFFRTASRRDELVADRNKLQLDDGSEQTRRPDQPAVEVEAEVAEEHRYEDDYGADCRKIRSPLVDDDVPSLRLLADVHRDYLQNDLEKTDEGPEGHDRFYRGGCQPPGVEYRHEHEEVRNGEDAGRDGANENPGEYVLPMPFPPGQLGPRSGCSGRLVSHGKLL